MHEYALRRMFRQSGARRVAAHPFAGWKPGVPYLLGVVMFCMGLTMTPADFQGVARRPWAVALGLVALPQALDEQGRPHP